jgi:hypothetical protein
MFNWAGPDPGRPLRRLKGSPMNLSIIFVTSNPNKEERIVRSLLSVLAPASSLLLLDHFEEFHPLLYREWHVSD